MRSILQSGLTGIAAAALLAACGGDGDSTTAAPTPTPTPTPVETTISGSAVKGPVNGATVTAKKADGSACGSATTNAQGQYSLKTTCTGDLIIEVSGGNYTDEATGLTTALSTPMRVVVAANGGTVTGIATPLTTMAYTYAFQSSNAVTQAAFDAQAQKIASQFGLSGVNLATTLPQVTGTTNAYGDSMRAISRYLATNNKTLGSLTNEVFKNAGDLTTFNTLYNNALIAVGSPIRVNFSASGFNISGTGAGGGTGTCGVRVTGSVTANGFTVPLDLNYCVNGIAAGSCESGNSSLSQALAGQQGVVGAANLQYSYSATCAAGAFTITLQ
jgi:hypothetical protein